MYIASLVLGILSLVLAWIPVVGFIIAIAALIVSIIAMAKKKPEGKGMGIAGIILSIIAVVIALIMTLLTVGAAYVINEGADEIVENAQNAINMSDKANAQAELAVILAEVVSENLGVEYTGYINEYTMKYTDEFNGIKAEEFYKNKLSEKGYYYNVSVNTNGTPNIE